MKTVTLVRGRNAPFILPPLLVICAVSTIWTACVVGGPLRRVGRLLSKLQAAVVIVQSALAFLMVFRLARAAERYWEARQNAGRMIAMCRVLVSTASAAMGAASVDVRRWALAFPVATKNYLRGTRGDARELEGLLSVDEIDSLFAVPCQPVRCVDAARKAVFDWASDGPLEAHVVTRLMITLDELTLNFGAMERINNTPLPFVYVSHLRSFLIVFLLAVPLVFASTWGWGTPPASCLVAFALLGIEAAAVECERPFARARNHFAFETFAAVIDTSIHQTADFFFPSDDAAACSRRVG